MRAVGFPSELTSRRRNADCDESQQLAGSGASAVSNGEGSFLRVLIAEDEAPLRLALCDLVAGEEGMEVIGAAASADEAIELAAATRPDVALVDVRMPGGGVKVVREVKERSPGTRVLALSAFDDQATVIEMLSAGAVGYLIKGTSASEIVEAVRRAARGQASLSIEAISSMMSELVGDTAERERTDGILRRSEERFRGLVESAPDAVVVIDEGGAMQLVNAETERLFGYTRDELMGQPIEFLLPEHFQEAPLGYRAGDLFDSSMRPAGAGLDPLGKPSERKEFPVDISVSALETVEGRLVNEGGDIVLVNEQTTGRRKDGSEFPVDISLAAIETDQGRLATAFIRDVSERRGEEIAARQLAAIVESSDDAIIGNDVEGTILTWNRGAARMYGYSAEEVVGRSVALLVPPNLPDDLPGILERLRSGEEVDQYETNRMRKDALVLDVVLKISAIRDVDGQIVGTSSIARDVTRFKAQAELERERALLAHLVGAGEEERGRIAAAIHDDSIQAITAAGMRLQILRRGLDDPEQLLLLDDLEETIQLSISRLRHLLFELHPPALHTDGLSAALELYLAETQSEGSTKHQLEDNLRVQPPAQVRTILYRIVQEVLANVRTHAQAEHATITLDERDYGYRVRVTDDGIGFAPDELKPVAGHLGLSAMKERASLAGGWLRIESAPGKGTTVEVWIPSLPVPESEPSASPSGRASSHLEAA
jgi:PAS domain S-box-containing protein